MSLIMSNVKVLEKIFPYKERIIEFPITINKMKYSKILFVTIM